MTKWRKSTFSDQTGQCVEVAELGDEIAVRNSNYPDRGSLAFPTSAMAAFIDACKSGEFDGNR
jgi:hypothetical protein